jgi:hypothetical protein
MLRWRWIFLFASWTLLAGCGDPPTTGGTPSAFFTPAEAAEQLQAVENDIVSIGNGLLEGVLNEAYVGLPLGYGDTVGLPYVQLVPVPGVLLLLQEAFDAPRRAPTGTFAFDDATGAWAYDPVPAAQLVVRWTSETTPPQAMELTVAWSGAQALTIPGGEAVDAPTRAVVRLTRSGATIADLTIDQSWRQTTCGRIAEAASLRISGTAGNAAAGVTFRDLGMTSPADGRWVVSGGADLRSGSLTLALDVSLDAEAALQRSPSDCYPETFEAGTAAVAVDLAGPGRTVALRFDAAGAPAAGGGVDVELRAGRFVVGSRRVEFAGTIPGDAADPAALVLLTFANGEGSTLRQFLERFGLFD